MKKKLLFIAIFIFIAIILYLNCFFEMKNQYFSELSQIGQTEYAQSVVFSTEIESADDVYDIISSVLKRYNANLYCSDIENIANKKIYTKYVFANNTKFFNSLSLSQGRFFNKDETESDLFLSTLKTDSPNQIGVINKFEKSMEFQIKTLKNYVCNSRDVLNKTFILQLNNSQEIDAFEKELKENGIITTINEYDNYSFEGSSYFIIIAFAATIILSLIILYDLIKSYKKIGIEKLMGYDSFAIWFSRVPSILVLEFAVFLIVTVILSMILADSFNVLLLALLKRLTIYFLSIIAVTAVMISLPFVFVSHIPVNAIVKNKKPFKSLIRFNLVIKCIITSILIIIMCASVSQIKTIFTFKYDKFVNWEKTRNFAYVPSFVIDNNSNWTGETDEDIEKFQKLYYDFNSEGGILADFSAFSPLYEDVRDETEFPINISVNINPNYLKKFLIKDENGETISISESEKDCVVLVPQKYKGNQKEIVSYYRDFAPSGKVKIIWTKNNQNLFTFAVDTGTDNYNTVKDPVLNVLTENNGKPIDYSVILGESGNPYKIKVKDYTNPTQEIEKICSKYFDLSEVKFPAVSVYQGIEDQISISNNKLKNYVAMIFLLFAMGLSIISQSIITYIEQYKKVLAVKKLMGFCFVDRYSRYLLYTLICYIISGIVAMIFINNRIFVLFITFTLFFIDFIFSYIYISIKDKKNIIQIVKGG